MSHELRTPLNSILILGQQLGDNPEGNLTAKQVEFARTIHGAGTDLLNLITDILDLSKIESGTVTVEAEEVSFTTLLETVGTDVPARSREPRASLSRCTSIASLGRSLVTDSKRLQQVLKNLLSNAFKFTDAGRRALARLVRHERLVGPTIRFSARQTPWSPSRSPTPASAFPPEKQKIIFEAFQQADASTSRKYGGTGLGLAISRELSSLLGGEIQLRSTPGVGQHVHAVPAAAVRRALDCRKRGRSPDPERHQRGAFGVPGPPERPADVVADDRDSIEPGDSTLLIVEDDPHYARVLVDLARDQRLQGAGRRARRRRRWRSRANSARRRFRSTSSCPTCSGGRC